MDSTQNNQANIKVYGADWCSHTQETLAHLDELGLNYQYIDVEQDKKASDWVKDQNDGLEIKPTLEVGGQVVTAPSDSDLDKLLQTEGILK